MDRYPEIAKFGMNEEELAKWHEMQKKQREEIVAQQSDAKEDTSSDNVTDFPADSEEATAAEEREAS